MIGAIIGDVVGSVYEHDNIKTKDFPLFDTRCTYTDDTILSVFGSNIRYFTFYRLEKDREKSTLKLNKINVDCHTTFGASDKTAGGFYLRDNLRKPQSVFLIVL